MTPGAASPDTSPLTSTDFAKLWNDFLPTVKPPIVDEPRLAALLAWAISASAHEMPHEAVFSTDADERFVQVEVDGGGAHDKLLVAG